MQRAIFIGKLQSGLKQRVIAQQHGITQSAVSKIKLKFIRTGTFLEDHGIERMEWPAKSPDMNPIENV